MELITLYNQHREKVGETYPRRAKQLVRNGRAAWLEDKVSLQLIATDQPPALKEENIMVDRNVLPSNDDSQAEKHQLEFVEDDNLLKYLARKNVQDRKNLIKHVIAFCAALLVFNIMMGSTTYELATEARLAVNDLNRVMITQTEEYGFELRHARRVLQSVYRMTNPVFVFFGGAMAAWGGWILFCVSVRVYKKFRMRILKIPMPDPVATEYARLKSMASAKLVVK